MVIITAQNIFHVAVIHINKMFASEIEKKIYINK